MRRGLWAIALLLVATAAPVAVPGRTVADPVPPAQPAPPPSSAATTLTTFGQSPWVPATGTWNLTVKVTDAPAGARLVTRVYDGLTSRESYLQSLTDADLRRVRWSDFPTQPIAALAPTADGNRLARIDVGVTDGGPLQTGQINPNQFGIFPVEVRVESAGGDTAARLVTHLVRLPEPDAEVLPLVTSLVVPVHAPPALQPDGAVRLPAQDQQRLRGVASAMAEYPQVPLTLRPTPETVVALATPSPDGSPETLDLLRSTAAADDHQVLSSTYVDVDQSAWVESGLKRELAFQRLLGGAALDEQLGVPPDGRTQVVESDVTPAALTELRERGVQRLVIPDRALTPLDESVTRTLTRPFQIVVDGQPLSAVQVDPGLEEAFTRAPADPILAAHHLLAELAMIVFESPATAQSVVLVPPPGAVLAPEFLGPLLDGLAKGGPVVAPATLDQLFAQVPLAGADSPSSESGPRLVRTLGPTSPLGLGSLPERLRAARDLLVSYRAMLVEGSAEAADLETQLLVAGSSDLSRPAQLSRIGSVTEVVQQQLEGVAVPEEQTVTLTATSGEVSLVVRNDLDVPVRVLIEVTANNRLEFPDLADQRRTEVIEPGATLRVSERVRVRGSGVVPMTVAVRTPDGRVLGSTRYRVQSTAVSGVGLFLTIAAGIFLAVWWARNWRRTRAERLAAEAAARQITEASDERQPVG